jgi:hypothetical protein
LAHAIGHYPFAWCRWPIDDLPPATPRPRRADRWSAAC